jgi:cellulose synthase/poly-beta-1,6-N-acetylglucosamine synthase-like glycosyltransferase
VSNNNGHIGLSRYLDFYHVVIIPFVDESYEVLSSTLEALKNVRYPKDRMMIVLASEGRMGEQAQTTAQQIKDAYGSHFKECFITTHPDGLPGEIRGKSANASWAVQSILPELEKMGMNLSGSYTEILGFVGSVKKLLSVLDYVSERKKSK